MAATPSAERHAQAKDAWGDLWRVEEARHTRHGFDVLLGRPLAPIRQGRTVICTPELLTYLNTRRYPHRGADLPIGATTVKRLRSMLGLDWHSDHADWWEERIADLCDLTIEAFSALHHRKPGAVERARLKLLGKTLREAGWWRTHPARDLLEADYPRAVVARQLDISIGSVGRLRWMLRRAAS